jgi:hypothetical protein
MGLACSDVPNQKGRHVVQTNTRRYDMFDDGKTEPQWVHRVMVKCAESGEGVPTGIRVNPASFKTRNLRKRTFQCPHCFQEHAWTEGDAWIEAWAC